MLTEIHVNWHTWHADESCDAAVFTLSGMINRQLAVIIDWFTILFHVICQRITTYTSYSDLSL